MSFPKGDTYPVTYISKDQLPKDLKLMPITDFFDKALMHALHVDDKVYDYICANATDEELDLIVQIEDTYSFAHRRKVAIMVNKYKEMYKLNIPDII